MISILRTFRFGCPFSVHYMPQSTKIKWYLLEIHSNYCDINVIEMRERSGGWEFDWIKLNIRRLMLVRRNLTAGHPHLFIWFERGCICNVSSQCTQGSHHRLCRSQCQSQCQWTLLCIESYVCEWTPTQEQVQRGWHTSGIGSASVQWQGQDRKQSSRSYSLSHWGSWFSVCRTSAKWQEQLYQKRRARYCVRINRYILESLTQCPYYCSTFHWEIHPCTELLYTSLYTK